MIHKGRSRISFIYTRQSLNSQQSKALSLVALYHRISIGSTSIDIFMSRGIVILFRKLDIKLCPFSPSLFFIRIWKRYILLIRSITHGVGPRTSRRSPMPYFSIIVHNLNAISCADFSARKLFSQLNISRMI